MKRNGSNRPCQQCGTPYYVVLSRQAGPMESKFCSKACAVLGRTGTIEECFWAKVDKNGAGGCWNWTASRKEKGYGQFLWKDKMHRAHRLAWTLSGRDLPPRPLELAHTCDNRLCVNPEHLRPATHQENMRECALKGRYSMARLNADQVREVRKLLAKGEMTQRAIGKLFGVKHGVINDISTGQTFGYIDG